MRIHEEKHGAVTVVRPEGPLTEPDTETLAPRLQTLARQSLGRFALDVSAVPYIDSAGLEMLADVLDQMTGAGQTLRLCSVNETLREVFDLTGLATQIEQYEDANSVVRSFL